MSQVQPTLRRADADRRREPAAVTLRCVVIGALGALAIGLIGPWTERIVQGSYLTMFANTPAAIALLFFIVAGPNLLLLLWRNRLALNQAELIVIFGMMMMASAVVTTGLVSYLLSVPTAPYYFASPENGWANTLLPHIPRWLTPQGAAQEAPVITDFYEGLGLGERVPWGAWLPTIGIWMGLLLPLYVMTICIAIILRKQWVDNEHLVYPLTYLPLSLAGADTGGRPIILRQPLFWIGFAVTALLASLKGLGNYYPATPTIRNGIILYTQILPAGAFIIWLILPVLGYLYFVNRDVLFSLWFFFLLQLGVTVMLRLLGISSTENLGGQGARTPIFSYLGAGVYFSVVGTGLWVARPYLARFWQAVTSPGSTSIDSNEILNYRTAFWTGVICALVVAGWLWICGLSVPLVILLLIVELVVFIGTTRITAETGIPAMWAPFGATMTAGWLGFEAFGARGITALLMCHTWAVDSRMFPMIAAAHTFKMADYVNRRRHLIFWGLLVALVLAIAVSVSLDISNTYHQGAISLTGGAASWTLVRGPRAFTNWANDWLTRRPGPSTTGIILTGLGAVLHFGLSWVRFRFIGWPLHPIGLALSGIGIMDWYWCTCLLAWLIKGAVLRYGGMTTYRRLRPLFLGLVCGQFVTITVWVFIDALTGHTGNMIQMAL